MKYLLVWIAQQLFRLWIQSSNMFTFSMELLSSPSSSQHQRHIIFSMTLFSSLMARLYTRVPVNKCLNFLNQWALNVLRGKGWQTSCKKWVWIKVFFFFFGVSYMLIVLLSSKEVSITSRISYLDSYITNL